MSTGGKRPRRARGETAADGGNGGQTIAGTLEDAMGVEDPPPLQPQAPTDDIPAGCEDVPAWISTMNNCGPLNSVQSCK